MKNLLTTLLALFLISNTLLPWQASAQSPEKMKYQAVIRDSNGHIVTNQAIGMQISIIQGDLPGTVIFTETQSLLSNAQGLTSTEIGTGSVVLGDFSTINWANGPYFLQIETDPTGGTNYTLTGTNQLLSVPYAMHAKTADSLSTNVHILSDADGDTKIQVEESPNDDIIRYDLAGTEFFRMDSGRLEILNTGSSVFIGEGAGANDSFNNHRSVALGHQALEANTTGSVNVAVGWKALHSNQTGYSNVAVGTGALLYNTSGYRNVGVGPGVLKDNTIGHQNTAIGNDALQNNTTGIWNQAFGSLALEENTTGSYNIAIGVLALANNTTGEENMAIGINALRSNTTGSGNTALGYASMISNTTGVSNTAHGYLALSTNTTGNHNTAVGKNASDNNYDGQRNTSVGSGALQLNYSGNDNTAIGFTALSENNFGDNNTAVGRTALFSNNFGNENTAIGRSALYYNTSGEQNTGLGRNALVNVTTGDNNTGVGYDAQVPNATGSNQVRIGNTAVSYAGVQVSWSITSDEIWKEQIRELPYGIDMLMRLKPVDYYRINNEFRTREMGFIAQDVEVLLRDMGYDDQGFLTKADNGNLSLRYNDFIALLTKAFQEQQEIIEQQKTEIETQNDNYKKLLKRIEQLEMSIIK